MEIDAVTRLFNYFTDFENYLKSAVKCLFYCVS